MLAQIQNMAKAREELRHVEDGGKQADVHGPARVQPAPGSAIETNQAAANHSAEIPQIFQHFGQGQRPAAMQQKANSNGPQGAPTNTNMAFLQKMANTKSSQKEGATDEPTKRNKQLGQRQSNQTIKQSQSARKKVKSERSSSNVSADDGEEYNFLNDSDVESQMDDFKLKEDDKESSIDGEMDVDQREADVQQRMGKSVSKKKGSASKPHGENDEQSDNDSLEDTQDQHHDEPEKLIISQMEEYYNQNYKEFEIVTLDDFVKTRVWDITYDRCHDYVYIFVGKIKQVSGKRLVQCKIPKYRKQKIDVTGLNVDDAPYQSRKQFSEMKMEMELDRVKESSKEIEALQVFADCDVELQLSLQIWNLDDRIMRDLEHRRRPIVEINVLKIVKQLNAKMSSFCQMNYFYNTYKDYAQLIQDQSRIIFFKDFTKITVFNLETFELMIYKNVKYSFPLSHAMENIQCFNFFLHQKDPNKPNQDIEFMHCYSYSIHSKQEMNLNHVDSGSPQMRSKPNQQRQMMNLRSISYGSFKETKLLKQNNDKVIKVKEQSISFKDDFLMDYSQNTQKRKLKSFFLKRIEDSGIYIVLFPTGLLMQVGTQPFAILSKIQLNLKKDETIVDFAYSVSDDRLNQAIWFLDDKLQVWKCVNELNPNSSNWTLIKVTMFDYLFYKQFIQPAMTYDDYYISSILNQLQCFKNVQPAEPRDYEFKLEFNTSCTKMVYMKQPLIRSEDQLISQPPNYGQEEDLQVSLERRLGFTQIEWRSFSIKIMLIAKSQQIIMNKIPEKKSMFTLLKATMNQKVTELRDQIEMESSNLLQKLQAARGIADEKAKPAQHDIKDAKTALENFNEVIELIYIGKVPIQKIKGGKEYVRQFLVRRRCQLDLLYTNGLNHWKEMVPHSSVPSPNVITDLLLSRDRSKLVMHYGVVNSQNQSQTPKTFYLSPQNKFILYEDQFMKNSKTMRNITLLQGKLFEVKFNLASKSRLRSNFQQHINVEVTNGQVMNISMPKQVFIKEFLIHGNPMERAMLSEDGRLIMSGRVVMQLNKDLDEVQNMGCFQLCKDNSFIHYEFLSLLQDEQRREISRLMRTNPHVLVEFSSERKPLTPQINKSSLYFLHKFDNLTGETSVIKLDTDTLACHEIYQSKFNLVHIAMFEPSAAPSMSGQKRRPVKQLSQKDLYRDKSSASNQKAQERSSQWGDQEGPSQKVFFSLVSQSKNHLNLEIISDAWDGALNDDDDYNEGGGCDHHIQNEGGDQSVEQTLIRKGGSSEGGEQGGKTEWGTKLGAMLKSRVQNLLKFRPPPESAFKKTKAKVEYFVNVAARNPIDIHSEVGWLSPHRLVVTLNNDFYLVNLKHRDLIRVKNDIQYGRQQLNMNIFASIAQKIVRPAKSQAHNKQEAVDQKESFHQETKLQIKHTQELIESQLCIQRMELATLRRFARLIKHQKAQNRQTMSLIFFTPTEELHGSNVFSKLSNNYNIIQPYLEMIDSEFISWLGQKVYNISLIVRPPGDSQNSLSSSGDPSDSKGGKDQSLGHKHAKTLDNSELFSMKSHTVHMYQSDISNFNAIDYAYQKNAIFCIKAFVDTMLILSDDNQFNNCFDRALLLMIERGLDVKELINSSLFYAPLWTNYSLFAQEQQPVICPTDCDIEDLEFEDPNSIFAALNKESSFSAKVRECCLKCLYGDSYEETSKEEMYEMQYNYIYLSKVGGDDVLSISRTLKNCNDLVLFEQEPIQHIIDYKWDTYTNSFFMNKFFLYSIFLIFYYIDIERGLLSMEAAGDVQPERIKDLLFYVNKSICIIVQMMFTIYEFVQVKQEGKEYFEDIWNYMEVTGMVVFYIGAGLDIYNPQISQTLRILWCFSVMFSLIKIIYLVRVFKQLNFLVTMLITVINEIMYFILLFTVFLLTFAECNHIVDVDISAYGRTPALLAHIFGVLRLAMGDQAMVDPYQTFDLKTSDPETGEDVYKHTETLMLFTFFLWLLMNFFLFMVFMNFIIAVIGESYSSVVEFKMAHDYHQRVGMIYEREIHFKPKDFDNQNYFPQILVVRQKKQTSNTNKVNLQKIVKLDTVLQVINQISQLRQYIKSSQARSQEGLKHSMRELKMHLTNTIKSVENDIQNMQKDQDKLMQHVRVMSESNVDANDNLKKRANEMQENYNNYPQSQQRSDWSESEASLQRMPERSKKRTAEKTPSKQIQKTLLSSKFKINSNQSTLKEDSDQAQGTNDLGNYPADQNEAHKSNGSTDQSSFQMQKIRQKLDKVLKENQDIKCQNKEMQNQIEILIELQRQSQLLIERNIMLTQGNTRSNAQQAIPQQIQTQGQLSNQSINNTLQQYRPDMSNSHQQILAQSINPQMQRPSSATTQKKVVKRPTTQSREEFQSPLHQDQINKKNLHDIYNQDQQAAIHKQLQMKKPNSPTPVNPNKHDLMKHMQYPDPKDYMVRPHAQSVHAPMPGASKHQELLFKQTQLIQQCQALIEESNQQMNQTTIPSIAMMNNMPQAAPNQHLPTILNQNLMSNSSSEHLEQASKTPLSQSRINLNMAQFNQLSSMGYNNQYEHDTDK